jgi:hypothetical protein
VLFVLLVGYVLSFLLFGITEGRKYLTSPPKIGEEYTTSVLHSEDVTLTLAGLAMTALSLFISVRYENLEEITSVLLFFSISFCTLVLSSCLTHFRTKRLFLYMSDVLSNTGLMASGCGFLSFFVRVFQGSEGLSLIFAIFVASFLVLSLSHVYKYHKYWKILETASKTTEPSKLPMKRDVTLFFLGIVFGVMGNFWVSSIVEMTRSKGEDRTPWSIIFVLSSIVFWLITFWTLGKLSKTRRRWLWVNAFFFILVCVVLGLFSWMFR